MKRMDFCLALGGINEDYVREAHAARAKRGSGRTKWGAVAACLVLVIAAAVIVRGGRTPAVPGNSGTVLTINILGRPPLAANADVVITTYDDLSPEDRETMEEAFGTDMGMGYDDFLERIPGKLRTTVEFYTVSAREYPASGPAGDYRLHDYVFECTDSAGARISIAMCGFEEPVRDYLIDHKAPELSDINGTTAVIFSHNGMYLAQFSCRGVYYDIETQGLDAERLEELLFQITA